MLYKLPISTWCSEPVLSLGAVIVWVLLELHFPAFPNCFLFTGFTTFFTFVFMLESVTCKRGGERGKSTPGSTWEGSPEQV